MDFDKVWHLLAYDPKNPLLFNSGFFLYMFLTFLLFYSIIHQKIKLRLVYLIIFSLYFFYKACGFYFLLIILSAIVDFNLSNWIYRAESKVRKKTLLILSITLNLGLLAYFKYTNFFIGIFNDAGFEQFHPLKIILPIGISFYTFENLSYTLDVYRGKFKPAISFIDYCFFLSFFPKLVAGPIVRASDFIPQIRKKIYVSKEDMGKALFLIVGGLFKKAVISDYISINFVDRVFDNPTLYSGFENLMAVYGYALQIYCDFSGYSDIAIGIALMIGIQIPMNFDSPYQSSSITEFWRRWHISLSSWLRDYLYISLGGNRNGRFMQYINLMITMLLGGLWHGASWKFVIWGGMHGVVLGIDKFMKSIIHFKSNYFSKFLGIIFTFHFVCFCWIFFRASSIQNSADMIKQILFSFKGEIAMQVLTGYKAVFILFCIGYLLHFLPQKIYLKTEQLITKSPLIAKSILLALIIWLIIQTKAADIQPFIYFQF